MSWTTDEVTSPSHDNTTTTSPSPKLWCSLTHYDSAQLPLTTMRSWPPSTADATNSTHIPPDSHGRPYQRTCAPNHSRSDQPLPSSPPTLFDDLPDAASHAPITEQGVRRDHAPPGSACPSTHTAAAEATPQPGRAAQNPPNSMSSNESLWPNYVMWNEPANGRWAGGRCETLPPSPRPTPPPSSHAQLRAYSATLTYPSNG
jgi:hypothetical protein